MFGENAGKQCCAMTIGAIVCSTILSPTEWESNTINGNLIESNRLLLSDPQSIPPSGYLLVNNFNVVSNDITMFGINVSLQFDEESTIFGSLEDRKKTT